MRQLLVGAVILCWSVCGAGPAAAQGAAPRVFGGAPAAPWIFSPGAGGNEFGVFHFRRMFELNAKPSSFVVHVSADNRYRLFVNGQQVSSGPQRSDLMHWRYETVDVAPQLRAGRNVIAALVWNWGADKPVAQFSRQTAFLLQGDSPREAVVNSGPEWKVLRNDRLRSDSGSGRCRWRLLCVSTGRGDRRAPLSMGLDEADFTEDGWVAAAAGRGPRANRTQLRASNPFGEAGGWQLMPRSIPPMEESPVRFATVRRSDGIAPDAGFLRGTSDFVVPAKTRTVILLDQGHLTNAFAVLETSGGAGSTVRLVYAEALKDAQGSKGNRNEIDGKTIAGVRDEFRLDGGERRRFQTLWFRTYRFVQLEIETARRAAAASTTCTASSSAYPFKLVARFDSDLAWLADMWAINWRGARLCAWETYLDTPYYEQLQYVGDTRIQALISLYMSGRRPSRASGDRALRHVAHRRGDHHQPLSLRAHAAHPDLLADLGRDGARLLDAP